MLQLSMLNRGRADDQPTIGDCVSEGAEHLGGREYAGGRAHGGARLVVCQVEGIDETQMESAKVAHSARSGAEIEGVARRHQDYAQAIEFSGLRQERYFTTVALAKFPCQLLAFGMCGIPTAWDTPINGVPQSSFFCLSGSVPTGNLKLETRN